MMPSELSSLYLFAFLIAKSGLMTGLLPGLFLAALVEAKYHRLMKLAEKLERKAAHDAVVRLDDCRNLLVADSRVLDRGEVAEEKVISKASGDGQLAHSKRFHYPAILRSGATSPSRKTKWRIA